MTGSTRTERADRTDVGKRRRRAAFFDEAADLTPYVAVEHGGRLLFVQTDDALLGRQVFCKGDWNDSSVLDSALEILDRWGLPVPTRSAFVDVGANIGTTTIHALYEHGFAEAVAVEPSKDNRRTLRINLAANDLDHRARLVEAAASDSEGSLLLQLSKRSSGRHVAAGSVEDLDDARRIERVRAVTLDGLTARGLVPERVGLLWIDTQGAEARVLRGARRLRRRGVPVVTAIRRKLERWDETRAALTSLLAPHYSHFVDLRDPERRAPTGDLRGLLENGPASATDILAFRSERVA